MINITVRKGIVAKHMYIDHLRDMKPFNSLLHLKLIRMTLFYLLVLLNEFEDTRVFE